MCIYIYNYIYIYIHIYIYIFHLTYFSIALTVSIAGVRNLEESCRSFQWGRGTLPCAVENNEDMTAPFLGDRLRIGEYSPEMNGLL